MNICGRMAVWLLCLALPGCAAFEDAFAPELTVKTDPFDGVVIVRQEPVSASNSLSEPSSLLGFYWKSLAPNFVVLTVNIFDDVDIDDLQFNADGQRIKGLVPLNRRTRRERSSTTVVDEQRFSQSMYPGMSKTTKVITRHKRPVRSRRSFAVLYTDFEKIARARTVVMRVFTVEDAVTSSFGTDSSALVNTRFSPFLEQIALQRSLSGADKLPPATEVERPGAAAPNPARGK